MRSSCVIVIGLLLGTPSFSANRITFVARGSDNRLAWCNRMTWGISPALPLNCTATHDARLPERPKTVDDALPPKAAAQVAARFSAVARVMVRSGPSSRSLFQIDS